jgi:DNA-binding NtrC family response regulator
VAIPGELAESMLFGHVKGAFTGATADRKGYFELAHGGAIFLDEIGDMPVTLQVKLLRVLEDGCVTPVGAAESIKVDVRVIAATNAELASRIAAGSFRQDLYFRLARYIVSTPPLRERLEDVPVLISHFLRMFAAEMGLKVPAISDEALAVLKQYEFPGNVRELKNLIERALIDSGTETIGRRHLHLLPSAGSVVSLAKQNVKAEFVSSLPLNLAEAEDLLIQRALQESNGNIADAARMLGVHRTRIYRKLAQEESVPGD